jgi:hypothetical protein
VFYYLRGQRALWTAQHPRSIIQTYGKSVKPKDLEEVLRLKTSLDCY